MNESLVSKNKFNPANQRITVFFIFNNNPRIFEQQERIEETTAFLNTKNYITIFGQTIILANILFSNSHLSAFASTSHISFKYVIKYHFTF